MASEADNTSSEDKSAEGKGKNLIYIVLLVVNLACAGIGLFFTYQATLGWKPPVLREQDAYVDYVDSLKNMDNLNLLFTLDKFTTNLAGEPRRSIRVEVNLEMLDKEGFEEVMFVDNRARIRDRILRLLGDKTFSDLETLQGKLLLKEQIAQEVNSVLAQGTVKDIFFTDFVVQ